MRSLFQWVLTVLNWIVADTSVSAAADVGKSFTDAATIRSVNFLHGISLCLKLVQNVMPRFSLKKPENREAVRP